MWCPRQKMEVEHVRHAFSVGCRPKQSIPDLMPSRVRRPDSVGVAGLAGLAGLCADKAALSIEASKIVILHFPHSMRLRLR
jgi:hypothetical protein